MVRFQSLSGHLRDGLTITWHRGPWFVLCWSWYPWRHAYALRLYVGGKGSRGLAPRFGRETYRLAAEGRPRKVPQLSTLERHLQILREINASEETIQAAERALVEALIHHAYVF